MSNVWSNSWSCSCFLWSNSSWLKLEVCHLYAKQREEYLLTSDTIVNSLHSATFTDFRGGGGFDFPQALATDSILRGWIYNSFDSSVWFIYGTWYCCNYSSGYGTTLDNSLTMAFSPTHGTDWLIVSPLMALIGLFSFQVETACFVSRCWAMCPHRCTLVYTCSAPSRESMHIIWQLR